MSAITGLCPNGEIIHHYSKPDKSLDVYSGAPSSFGPFIEFHNKKKGVIFDEEHVVFFALVVVILLQVLQKCPNL